MQGRANPSLPPLQLFYLEEQRRLKLQQLATLIQKVYRGWRCRTHYQQMRKSQILISAWFRGNKVPRPFPSVVGGLWFRVWPLLTVLMFPQQRKHYGKIKASTLLIQAFVRGWKVTKGRAGGSLLGYAPGCDTETALLLWPSWLWVCVWETGLGVFPP